MDNSKEVDYLEICCELAERALHDINPTVMGYKNFVSGRYKLTQIFIILVSYFLIRTNGLTDNLYIYIIVQ